MEKTIIQTALRGKGKVMMTTVSYIVIFNRNPGRVEFALCFEDEEKQTSSRETEGVW